LFYALDVSLFFGSVKVTSIADAAFIGSLQPVLVLFVAAPLFNEVIGRREVFVTLAAVAGVAFVLFGSPRMSAGSYVGDLLALAAVLAYTGYWLVSKVASRTSDALDYTTGTVVVAALFLTPVLVVSRSSLVSDKPVDWVWLILLVVTSGSANLAMNWAHRFVDLSVSSVIVVGNPIVAASGALVILGQPITVVQVIGGMVTIVAIYLMVSRSRSRPSSGAALTAA
jgi:drug/metabolite transporter (DMT)-like permease